MSFFQELKRRNVIRVAIFYLVAAWLTLQITDVLSSLLTLPETLGPLVVLLLALGFIPVLVMAWVFEFTPEGLKRESEIDRSQPASVQSHRRMNALIIFFLVLVIAGLVAERLMPIGAQGETETPLASAQPAKPSIAVLEFANLSGDPKQEFVATGMTEDIITKLTYLRGIRVISRNSSIRYADQHADPKQIGAELGVQHLLTGSVRGNEERLRSTAMLVDTATEETVWAEQWDRPMADIFTLQDEITANIINELEIELVEGEQRRIAQQGTRNPVAYTALRRGIHDFEALPKSLEHLVKAREWFATAIKEDAQYSAAYAWTGLAYAEEVVHNFSADPDASLTQAEEWVQKAFAIDANLSLNHDALGWISALRGDWDQAFESQSKALELAPGNADVLVLIGETLCVLDRPQEALAQVSKGMDLNPYPPWWYWWGLAQAQLFAGEFEASLESSKRSLEMYAGYERTRINLILALMALDREKEAREQARALLQENPQFQVETSNYLEPMRNKEQQARFYAMLRAAGLS